VPDALSLEASAQTAAAPATAWAVLTDVTAWPEWTASMTSVERLDEGPLRIGSRVRIKQPGMPPMIWEVDEVREQHSFSWSSRMPGLRISGHHRLRPDPDGTTRIIVEIEQHGPLAGIVGLLTGGRSRRYLQMEAGGLKAASEVVDLSSDS
jgi:uncharacterized membrane protein